MSIDPLLADAHEDDDAWFIADLEFAMARRAAYAEARGEARGIEQGIERGIERGIEQGIERGIEQGIERGTAAERARAATETRGRLLRLASVAVDAETLVALEAIHDVDALEAAVMAALADVTR